MNDDNTPGNSQQNRRQIQRLRADLNQQTQIHENIIAMLTHLQAELDDLTQRINNIGQQINNNGQRINNIGQQINNNGQRIDNSTSSSSKEEKSKKR